jgi:hypothetical protein
VVVAAEAHGDDDNVRRQYRDGGGKCHGGQETRSEIGSRPRSESHVIHVKTGEIGLSFDSS